MSTTNLTIILINLFFLSQLPIKQPIKVNQHNISTPKTGIQDHGVTHHDCSPKHITNIQYYKLNKIGVCKIKPADFKILPAQVHPPCTSFFTNSNTTCRCFRHTRQTWRQGKLLSQDLTQKRLSV